tara:strand:- start:1687 stop:1968 length:282 start_codon:yes stop_codon:yes gene_type:complete
LSDIQFNGEELETVQVRLMLMGLMGNFPNHVHYIEPDWTNIMIVNLIDDLIQMSRESLKINRTVVEAHTLVNGYISYRQAEGIVKLSRAGEEE